jgi:hypothetical protein
VAWIVFRDTPDYTDKYIVRLAMNQLAPYLRVSQTLVDIRKQLPPGHQRSSRQSSDLSDVVEVFGLSYERVPAA